MCTLLDAKSLNIHVSEQAQMIKVTLSCSIITNHSHLQNKSLLGKKFLGKVFVLESIKEVAYE